MSQMVILIAGALLLFAIYLIFFRTKHKVLDLNQSKEILSNPKLFPELDLEGAAKNKGGSVPSEERQGVPYRESLHGEGKSTVSGTGKSYSPAIFDILDQSDIAKILKNEAQKRVDSDNTFKKVMSLILLLVCFFAVFIFREDSVITNLCVTTIGVIVGYWFKN